MTSKIAKRSIIVGGRKTSVSLEDEFWQAFQEIAKQQRLHMGELVDAVMRKRLSTNLSSAIRLFVLAHFRSN